MAPEPRSLVEAVVGVAWLGDEYRQPEHRSLGRGTANGQLELETLLADVAAGEALDARRKTDRVLRAARRPGHDHASDGGTPDLRGERTPIDHLHPQRAPPPAAERQSQREQREPRARRNRRHGGEDRQRRDGERPAPVNIGGRDPRAEAREQQVGNVEREPPDHGTTSSRSSSIVAGPIHSAPRQLFDRAERPMCRPIIEDLLGGYRATPGSVSSWSSVAALRLTGPAAAPAAAVLGQEPHLRPCAARAPAAHPRAARRDSEPRGTPSA